MTGKTPDDLVGPDLPFELQYLWGWFAFMRSARQSNGFGASALLWSEMEAFFRLIDVRPLRWELDLLRRLDVASLTSEKR